MAWNIPEGLSITATTKIKDTDDRIASIVEDMENYVNGTDDYVGVGLTDSFVTKDTAQTITGDKVFSGSLTGSLTGNADSATTLTGLTSAVDELNYVDGVTSDIQAQIDGKASLTYVDNATSVVTQSHTNYPLKSVKFPDGTMIASGRSESGFYAPTTVFLNAFIEAPHVTISLGYESGYGNNYTAYINSIGTTSFTYSKYRSETTGWQSTDATFPVHWMAIGRWK